jgi:hypothetical protein
MKLSATIPKKPRQHASITRAVGTQLPVDDFVKECLKDSEVHKMHAHPEDYKNWLDEDIHADNERTDAQVAGYKMEDQEELTDEDNSLINFRNVNSFIKTLRENGVKCKVFQDRPDTCGLYCVVPGKELLGYQFITSMQVPVMPEWGLLHEEEHGVANGEAAIGWRQVLAQLILHLVMDEWEVHRIFGFPAVTKRTERYRRTLHAFRNGKVAHA